MSPNVRRSWSPRGVTPVLKHRTRSRKKISAMGALAATPGFRKVFFMFRLLPEKNFGAHECLAFLRQLLANLTGRVILVWDRFLAHRSKIVKKFIERNPRLTVEYLPPYAPDLNPVEPIWAHLKMNKMANYCCKTSEELSAKAKSSLCSIRRERPVLKNILKHVPLKLN